MRLQDKAIEEMSKLTQALIKIEHFGLFNHHPDISYDKAVETDSLNIDTAIIKCANVINHIDDLYKYLIEIKSNRHDINIQNKYFDFSGFEGNGHHQSVATKEHIKFKKLAQTS